MILLFLLWFTNSIAYNCSDNLVDFLPPVTFPDLPDTPFPDVPDIIDIPDIPDIPKNDDITRFFTNEDGTQNRLLQQVSRFLLKNYGKYIRNQHVLKLANPSEDSITDMIVIAPGYYEIRRETRSLKITVTESAPVGLQDSLAVYRTLSITGYEKDVDNIIRQARLDSQQDDRDSIRVYQSTVWGEWDSGTLSGYNTLQKRNISTVFLEEGMVNTVLCDVRHFLNRSDIYHKHGIPYHRNYLLTGPPGTGKTSLIHAIASELDMGIAMINFHRYYDKRALTKNMINLPKRTLIVVEDIDSLYSQDRNGNSDYNGLTFSDFINAIDGFSSSNKGTLLFMTTNHPDRLDPALLRPGRVDLRLILGYATYEQVRDIFESYYPEPNIRSLVAQFYRKIMDLGIQDKLTTASLQNFFFKHLGEPEDALLNKVSELVEYVTHTPLKTSVN